MFNKIFCIGFNKTGTTSMHRLFAQFGLKTYHGLYNHIPLTADLFRKCQCFSDGDMHNFELLDKTFSGSKFILTTRRLDDWLISRIMHVEHRRSLGRTGEMRIEYESNPELAVKQWIKRRLAYHRRVQEYFSGRDSDLLVVNICDGHDQQQLLMDIADFLNLKISPDMMFPRANESKRRRQSENTSVRKKSDVRAEVMNVMKDIGLEKQYQNIDFP